jgi:hypothetical protein
MPRVRRTRYVFFARSTKFPLARFTPRSSLILNPLSAGLRRVSPGLSFPAKALARVGARDLRA